MTPAEAAKLTQTKIMDTTKSPTELAAVPCSPLLGRWAEKWRTDTAYGNGQPEIHPTHAKVIAEFSEARQEIADMTAALNGIHNALDECLMVPANVLPAWNAVIDILRRWHEANSDYPHHHST